jgi:large subunit ribosomal protein L6
MSRVGSKPIPIPKDVTVTVTDTEVTVKGPKGQLKRVVVSGVGLEVSGEAVSVSRENDTSQYRANHGLMRSLVNNMVLGVSKGFEKNLEIIGVGYKASVQGNKAVFNLGYSHPIQFPFPDGVTIAIDKNTKVRVTGIDKEKVGQAAAEIRGFRPPDSYKGKGVRYLGEYVRLKAGKTAQ